MALTYADPDIKDVILFTADGANSFSYSAKKGRSVYPGYAFESLPYIEEFKASSAAITVIYDPAPPYLSLPSGKEEPTISYIVKIYERISSSDSRDIGYMMVNYPLDAVAATYGSIEETSDGDYFVLNNQSVIIYSNDESKLGVSYSPEWLPEGDIISQKPIGISGIEVICALADHKLKQASSQIVHRAVLIIGIGVLCTSLVIMLLHRYYTRKFHSLVLAMTSISTGDFSTQLPVESRDEIGYLSESFNSMSRTLNEYIQKTYLAQTQRRTAELYALQAQINPHFLANTIESIRMHAMETGGYDTAEMLKKLGSLFRCMIQFDSDIIDVEDEIEYISAYLDLQKFRFQDKLSVDMDFSPDIYYLGIPRFILQPVIENTLSHNHDAPKAQILVISIRLFVEHGILNIMVQDNGSGIPLDTLDRLKRHIQGIETFEGFGVALRNVHSRITLLFGPEYGLEIDSTYQEGTTVIIRFPAKERKELEEYVQTAHC